MNHCGTQTIETERLILRRFRPEDADAMYRNWASDPEVTKYLMWPTHDSPEVSRAVTESWVKEYGNPDHYQWAITVKANGEEPIGDIAVVDRNKKAESLHIGYCIGSKWWHQGITSEAFSAIIPFLFDEVGANRIESQHDPQNPHSGNVMKKCGLQYEGTLRSNAIKNGKVMDMKMYSLLREEE